MSWKDDSPVMTWGNFAGATMLLFALGATVVSVSGAADNVVNAHNESDISHPKKITTHNTDKFAHEQMRKMMREEMEKTVGKQTVILLEAIKKTRETGT